MSPPTDSISATSPTSHSADATFKLAHEDAGSNTRDVSSSTARATAEDEQSYTSTPGKEADAEFLNFNTEITDEKNITGDEDQGFNETMFNKINYLFGEAISNICKKQDLL